MNVRLWYDRETSEIMCEMPGTTHGCETFSLTKHLEEIMRRAQVPVLINADQIARGVREAKYGSGPDSL